MAQVLRGRRLPRRRPLLTRHRRFAASVLLAVAAGLTVDAVAAGPPDGVPLLVAARDLPAGHEVTGSDVTTVPLPPAALPDGALPSVDVVGATLAGPLRRGEPVTDAALTGPGVLVGAPPGSLAVPVPLSGPAVSSLLRVGDTVAVLAGPSLDGLTGTGEVIVRSAVVVALPQDDDGLLAGSEQASTVVLALDPRAATRVAAAVGQRPLMAALLR